VALPPFDSVTVADLAGALAAGAVTSRSVVEAHLRRIEQFDPAFGSIRAVAADALDQADASDAIRASHGPRSPLEGIPVLIKDNIDVAGLPTTAGAVALEHSMPARDAPLVARLRAAGAVILGKTNLSELANFLTDAMPSGYSSLGGQVLNPYDTSLTPSGSSSGSGAAVALGLAPLAVGTETDGSITSPAEHQSLVGFKPTLGLVSRTGILPISASQDTAGPMTRTVADAAALLAVIAGPDPADAATASAVLSPTSLDARALEGVRIGVVRGEPDGSGEATGELDADDEGRQACHAAALDALRIAGADLVDVTLPVLGRDDEMTVLHYEFGVGVDHYLATLDPEATVRTLAELGKWNREHAGRALKFGQTHVERAVAIDHEADRDAYLSARARDLQAATAALSTALGADLEALAFPGADGCSLAARAGWPSVVIPAGYTAARRRPVGLMLVSRPWTDARLLSLAYALEQAHPVRRTPEEINPAAFRQRCVSSAVPNR
jgi:amidase